MIKDICAKYDDIIEKATFVVKFITGRSILLSCYQLLKQQFKVKKHISLPVETRWYTQYNCLKNLVENARVKYYFIMFRKPK